MAVLQKGSPWGELSPVGRLRGVVLMHMFCFVEPISVIAARCHPPQGAFLSLREIYLV